MPFPSTIAWLNIVEYLSVLLLHWTMIMIEAFYKWRMNEDYDRETFLAFCI